MGKFYNVTEANPCPICGKPDWCSILIPDVPRYVGQKLYVCRRILVREILSPVNGNTYCCIKELADSSALYGDKDFPQENMDGRKGYAYRPGKNNDSRSDIKRPRQTPLLANDRLDAVYRDFLRSLTLSPTHQKKLEDDGWPQMLIQDSKIRSLCLPRSFDREKARYSDQAARMQICRRLIESHASLEGVPGFYLSAGGAWTFAGQPGMLIPLYDTAGNMYRLRLRLDHAEKNLEGKEKNKYKNFSSYRESTQKDGTPVNAYPCGCRAGSQIGVYYNPSCDSTDACYITEGEKKAIVANYVLQCPVISLPGVNTFGKLAQGDGCPSVLAFLKLIGCSTTVIAYDADKHVNPHVLRCEQKLALLLQKESFRTYLAEWNPGFGKGLDDILLIGLRPRWIPV